MKYLIGLAAFTLIAAGTAASAASSSYTCDVAQGFNFQKDEQTIVGHINYIKIGDMVLASDLNAADPLNTGKSVKVAGIASAIHWNGGYAEPVTFAAQVSVDNKNKLAVLQHKTPANTTVEFQFTIYDFDHKAKTYFKAFHSNGVKLKGLVLKQGAELALNISMDQSEEVVSPKNYTFQLGVLPQDQSQEIHLAFSKADKLVKSWGVTVAADSGWRAPLLRATGI